MKNIVIIMGGPGSGKGTIAELLLKLHRFNYIETGALFRSLSSDSDIAKIMERGGLIPDKKIFPLIMEHTSDNTDVLFDGFPRNIAQAKWLVDKFQNNIINVVYLKLSKDIMIQRINKRLSEGSSRIDDMKKEIIQKRLFTFESETLPAIKFFNQSSDINFIEIDGLKTPDEIADVIKDYLPLLKNPA